MLIRRATYDRELRAAYSRGAGLHHQFVDNQHDIAITQLGRMVAQRDERIAGLEAELEEARARVAGMVAQVRPQVVDLTAYEVGDHAALADEIAALRRARGGGRC